MLLIMCVTLYTSRVVLSALGVVDFGIYNVVGGIVVMFSFLNGAMAQSTQRFLSYEIGRSNLENLKNTFKTALTIHILIALGVLILSETLGLWFLNCIMNIPEEHMSSANWVYQCSIISFVISIIQVPFNAAIIARERMQIYAYMGILEVFLKLGIALLIPIISFYDRLKIYAIFILIVTLIICLIYQIYCTRHFKECVFELTFRNGLFKTMSKYAAWNTVGNLAWVGKYQGSNLILNIFFGPAINAAYGIAGQVNVAVNNFVQNFSTAINPQIIKSYSAERFHDMERLIIYGAKISFFLILIISFPILLSTERLLNIWLVEVPDYAVIFTQLVIIDSIIESFSYSLGTGIQATGKIKWYQIIVGCTKLFNLPLSYIFLKLNYAPYSIFTISIILSITMIFERLLIIKVSLPYFSIKQFIRIVLFPAFMISAMCGIIYIGCLHLNFIHTLNIFIIPILAIITITITVLWCGFNKSERNTLYNFVRSKYNITTRNN